MPPKKRTRAKKRGKAVPVARIRIGRTQRAQFDAWFAESKGDESVAELLALAPKERARRYEDFVNAELAKSRERIDASEERLAEAEINSFVASVEVVRGRRNTALARGRSVLEESSKTDASSMERALSDAREAESVRRHMAHALGKAAEGERALADACAWWDRGIHAACARRLARLLALGGDQVDAVSAIAKALGRSPADLATWLADHAGDRKADGPAKTARRAIGALVGVAESTIRRGATCERFFDRTLDEDLGGNETRALDAGGYALAAYAGLDFPSGGTDRQPLAAVVPSVPSVVRPLKG